MANSSAPFGFMPNGTLNGPVNFATRTRLISSSNSTATGFGDALVPVTSTANGYVKQAPAGTTPLAGIFVGCSYYSIAQKKTVYSNYWPGSDASADVTAFVVDDPLATFVCQAGNTNIGPSLIGQNAILAAGSGTNTTTGWSGMYLNTVGTNSTYPFIVLDVPNGATDPIATGSFNWVIVGFNNMVWRANQTGIS